MKLHFTSVCVKRVCVVFESLQDLREFPRQLGHGHHVFYFERSLHHRRLTSLGHLSQTARKIAGRSGQPLQISLWMFQRPAYSTSSLVSLDKMRTLSLDIMRKTSFPSVTRNSSGQTRRMFIFPALPRSTSRIAVCFSTCRRPRFSRRFCGGVSHVRRDIPH